MVKTQKSFTLWSGDEPQHMGDIKDEYVSPWCFNADIRKGDTLGDPQHLSDGEIMSFDRVMRNPPFSLKKWGKEEGC